MAAAAGLAVARAAVLPPVPGRSAPGGEVIRRSGPDTWTITVPTAGGTVQLFLSAADDGTVVLTLTGSAVRLDQQHGGEVARSLGLALRQAAELRRWSIVLRPPGEEE